MKANFDVTISIDGNKVVTSMGLQKGFEGMNPDAFSKVQTAVLSLKKELEIELQKKQKKWPLSLDKTFLRPKQS